MAEINYQLTIDPGVDIEAGAPSGARVNGVPGDLERALRNLSESGATFELTLPAITANRSPTQDRP